MTASETMTRSLPARTILALAIAAAAAVTFVTLAEDVVDDDAAAFDFTVIVAVQEHATPALDVVMNAFTFMGSVWGIVLLMAGMLLWALYRRARGLALVMIASSVLAEAINELLKRSFDRARPELYMQIDPPIGASFPSAHSMVSIVAFGMAAVVASRLVPSLRLPLRVLTPITVLMIGVSRVYLGVHWPTDILGGFAAGSFVLVGGMLAVGKVSMHRGEAPEVEAAAAQ